VEDWYKVFLFIMLLSFFKQQYGCKDEKNSFLEKNVCNEK